MPGKRIVFCTFGSLGDIYPYVALARELRRNGDDPVIATISSYRRLIEEAGIRFYSVRPDIDVSDPAILSKVMDRQKGGKFPHFRPYPVIYRAPNSIDQRNVRLAVVV